MIQRRNFFEVNFTLPSDENQKFYKWMTELEKKDWDFGVFEDGEFKSLDVEELSEKAKELDEEETDSDIAYVFIVAKIIVADEEDEFESARDKALDWLERRDSENGWEVTWIDEEEFEEEVDDKDDEDDEEDDDDEDDEDDDDEEEDDEEE